MPSWRYFALIAFIVCGKCFSRGTDRIVGGDKTDIHNFPFLLSLSAYDFPFCGAVIISEDWALTAAHCVRLNSSYTVKGGSSLKNGDGSYHNVTKKVMHPLYDRPAHDYDFAVIKVSPAFEIDNKTLAKIDLTETEPEVGENVTVTGWGRLAHKGSSTNDLYSVQLSINDRNECDEVYPENITTRMICASAPGKDSCAGDSGGPMINKDGILVGLVSWGEGCATPNIPGVYSNIADQRDWIRSVTGI